MTRPRSRPSSGRLRRSYDRQDAGNIPNRPAGRAVLAGPCGALGKVAALLGAGGCTPADVVSCLVHLADLSDFQGFNAVYERHFPEPRPVRTTVGAALLGGAKVEITAIARRPAHP